MADVGNTHDQMEKFIESTTKDISELKNDVKVLQGKALAQERKNYCM